jgi:hypothetical protein
MTELAAHKDWATHNKAFLDQPPDNWYRIVADLRERVKTDARRSP